MIKIEMHCHSKGGSVCATTPAEDVAKIYKSHGYGGIVLTNHLAKNYYDNYKGESHKEKMDFYFSLIRELEDCCSKLDMKVFYGAEIKEYANDYYSEFMLLGFEEKFLYDNKPLFSYTQEELFRLAEKNNIFMYQTHPFRQGIKTGKPEFMHGAESFNGHFHHINNNRLAEKFCEENSLVKLTGTDFHHHEQPITAGMMIPENICDNVALAEFIRSGKAERVEDVELYETTCKIYKGL